MKKRWMVSLMASGNGRIHGSVRQKFGGGTENAGSSAPAGPRQRKRGPAGRHRPLDAGEPVDGGVLTISLSSSPKNLDPVKYTGTYESQIIGSVCDTLVEYNSSLTEIMPLSRLPGRSAMMEKEYTFKLRDDVYFQPGQYQDGRQVTAEDIEVFPGAFS